MKSVINSRLQLVWSLVLVAFVLAGCASDESAEMNSNDHASMDSSVHKDSMLMDDMRSQSDNDMSSMTESNSRNDVHLSAAVIQSIGVRFATSTIESLAHTVRTTGKFEMDEQAAYVVSPKISGFIENLHADYNGKQVEQGDHLFDLYSPELVATQEELLTATRHLDRLKSINARVESVEQAERVVDAVVRRLALWDIGADVVESIINSGEPVRAVPFMAPSSGEIMQKQISEGSYIATGTPVLKIFDVSKIWLIVDINEQDITKIGVGTLATIHLLSNPRVVYESEVEHIYHMLNSELRTAKARIILPAGHHSLLKPGMFATVTLHGLSEEPAVTVPTGAVLRDGKSEFVILSLGEGMFRPVAVRSGVESEGKIQILEGLEGDEVVVMSAQFLIDSEAQLGSAMASMMGMEM